MHLLVPLHSLVMKTLKDEYSRYVVIIPPDLFIIMLHVCVLSLYTESTNSMIQHTYVPSSGLLCWQCPAFVFSVSCTSTSEPPVLGVPHPLPLLIPLAHTPASGKGILYTHKVRHQKFWAQNDSRIEFLRPAFPLNSTPLLRRKPYEIQEYRASKSPRKSAEQY